MLLGNYFFSCLPKAVVDVVLSSYIVLMSLKTIQGSPVGRRPLSCSGFIKRKKVRAERRFTTNDRLQHHKERATSSLIALLRKQCWVKLPKTDWTYPTGQRLRMGTSPCVPLDMIRRGDTAHGVFSIRSSFSCLASFHRPLHHGNCLDVVGWAG